MWPAYGRLTAVRQLHSIFDHIPQSSPIRIELAACSIMHYIPDDVFGALSSVYAER